jgi:hypothetical protein
MTQEDLRQVNTEIRWLQEKKAGIQKSIDTYNVILSPVRRLILREIFYYPVTEIRPRARRLTRICSIWRAIALTKQEIPAVAQMSHDGIQSGAVTEYPWALDLLVSKPFVLPLHSLPSALSLSLLRHGRILPRLLISRARSEDLLRILEKVKPQDALDVDLA